MKYCKRCNTLLEDNLEICIGCGNDVSGKDGYTKYPVDMQQKIDREADEDKRKRKSLFVIILLCVLIVILLGLIIVFFEASPSGSQEMESEYESDITKRLSEFISQDTVEAKENSTMDAKEDEVRSREVNDENGNYYLISDICNESEQKIFHTIIPEDLSETEYSTDGTRVDFIYPAVFSFVASNDENTAKFTYTSPQHYIGLSIDGKQNADSFNASSEITYYNFKDAQSYLETLISQGYKNARSVKLTQTVEIDDNTKKKLLDYISKYAEEGLSVLLKQLNIECENPEYELEACVDAKLYYYDIVDRSNRKVHCIFYLPVVSNKYTLMVENVEYVINDCYVMTVESFEAGSPALYEWYKECFDVFLNNSYLMDDYYKIETQKGLYKPSYELASRILNTSPFATKEFVNHEYVITSGDYFKQMFLNTEKASLYATSDEKEYPGEDFLILWEEK